MANEPINLRDELLQYKFDLDLLQRIPCTKQENKQYRELLKRGDTLPKGVYPYVYDNDEAPNSEFYTIYEADLTEDETKEYLALKQLALIKAIKNYVFFFVFLAVLGIIVSVLFPFLF